MRILPPAIMRFKQIPCQNFQIPHDHRNNSIKMKEKIRKILQFILNPRLLFCILIAWTITNGWSYILFGIGTYFKINWMTGIAGAYLAFLWLPVSPEKLATFAISIALLRFLFPNDQKTLAVLRELSQKTKNAIKKRKLKKQGVTAEQHEQK